MPSSCWEALAACSIVLLVWETIPPSSSSQDSPLSPRRGALLFSRNGCVRLPEGRVRICTLQCCFTCKMLSCSGGTPSFLTFWCNWVVEHKAPPAISSKQIVSLLFERVWSFSFLSHGFAYFLFMVPPKQAVPPSVAAWGCWCWSFPLQHARCGMGMSTRMAEPQHMGM